MITGLSIALIASSLLLAAWAGWTARRDRGVDASHLVALGVVEALTVAQLVVGLVKLGDDGHPESTPTFVGYLVGSVVLLPAAAWLARLERNRWGSAIVAAGGVIVCVLVLRLRQIWAAPHG